MDYTSYQSISENSQSLNTGSYLNSTEYAMFVNGFVPDLWYGLSAKDVVEIGLWDRSENQIGWDILYQSKSYDTVAVSYFDIQNNFVTYSYQELIPDFILNQTNNILVEPTSDVSSSFFVLSGSFNLTYNLTREMAGSPAMPLVIKDIAPSRTEVKLLPLSASDSYYDAFCQHQVLMQDVSPLYVSSLAACPYGQILNIVTPLYTDQINTIKNLFFISSDGGIELFFRNLYEDLLIYSSTPIGTQTFVRIQGIQTYFTNYLLSNAATTVNFGTIDSNFGAIVSASIERKFAPVGLNPSQEYVSAKAFVYDFFTQYFYTPISNTLQSTYNDKYFGYFKNALNLGNNRLLPILSVGMMDERTSPNDPLTLLIKLKDGLPSDLTIQTQCWVSNISLVPQIVSSIFVSNTSNGVYQIGPPNFSIPIPYASLTNANTSYTANDLQLSDDQERQVTISQNIQALSVDYTDFSNFVLFSSAEMRLKVFKNKSINLYGLSSSLATLNTTANAFLVASGSIYPYYQQEYTSIQTQMDKIINTFDGYESYLYDNGSYAFQNGAFVSASYVASQDVVATQYDTDNRDSLVNTCPEHVLNDPDNDDYVIFLSMIGHFFDNIYIYIANMPSEKKLGNDTTSVFSRQVVDYMLETFGWDVGDSLEQTDLLNNFLTSDQVAGLNSMSAEDRLKTIRNRILQNLPAIYKAKGTDEAVQLILGCYGIPSPLLSIREYGGVNYTDPTAAYTLYERVYMRQWDTSSRYDSYDLQVPTGSHTYLFKINLDDSTPYTYGNEQILFGRVQDSSNTSLSGSGEWSVGFVRIPKKNTGQIFFQIGYKGQPSFKIYSPDFPLFDGTIYSVMVRRNYPDDNFDFTTNPDSIPTLYDLYVKRNQFGNQDVAISSSAVCYDAGTNSRFSQGGLIKIGGWFADYNGQGFTGAFDKLQVWANPILDTDLEDYTNNFNAYTSQISGAIAYQSLFFRMHTDYPFNQQVNGTWRNGNPYFAVSSSIKLNTLYGEPNCDVDYLIGTLPWSGSTEIVQGACGPISQSVYPWQWKVFDYPSTWGISQYGPNKFRNEKTKYVTQSLQVRLDNLNRSTYVDTNGLAPDSNQVGFYADPQDFKNRDVVRYFGNYNFMDAIGDPDLQYSQSYDPLRLFRKEFANGKNQFSGSRTLFSEILTAYKLYFNRSVFDSIKNVVPARTNALVGIVIEPTILERPKYQSKPIDARARSAFEVPIGRLMRMTASLYPSSSVGLHIKYVSYPNKDFPVNYGGNYIGDLPDRIEFGHFAGGVPSRFIDFSASYVTGDAPISIQFYNLSYGADTYVWDFGDGVADSNPAENVVKGNVNPLHTYLLPGVYTVTLTGYYGAYGLHNTKVGYINLGTYNIVAGFTADQPVGQAPLTVNFTNNSSLTAVSYSWDFGSGSATSQAFNPSQVYTTPGIYNVTLTANNGQVTAGQYTSQSYITVLSSPNICTGPYSQLFTGGIYGVYHLSQSYAVSMGSLLSPVTTSYTAGASASRYVVTLNGVTEYDSLWVSNSGTGSAMINAINAALRPYGAVTSSFLSASSLNVVAASDSTQFYFDKDQSIGTGQFTIFNPFNTTSSFTMSCPTPLPLPLGPSPVVPIYSCGTAVTIVSDTNGNAFPTPFFVNFSNADDDFALAWSATSPVRIVLYYNGNPQNPILSLGNPNFNYNGSLVGDTGYMGDPNQQGALNTALLAHGAGAALITPVTPINGVSSGELQTSFFEQQMWEPLNYLTVEIYAPIPNTQVTIAVGCPY